MHKIGAFNFSTFKTQNFIQSSLQSFCHTVYYEKGYLEFNMNFTNYLPRLIDERLALYLSTFGAICLEGPK